jgi:hypothetical protein
MRRASLYVTMLVLSALLLAACGGQQTSTSLPSTNVPPVTVESTSTSAMTEAPTEAPTSALDMTSTPSVPVTGGNSPARVSNLIGSSVCGTDGTQVGTVQDLVVDFDQTMVSYVVVDANGKTLAVPWTSFDLTSAMGNGTGTGTGSGTGVGTGLETSTPSLGTGLETSTPSSGTGTGLETSTPASSTGSGTGTGTGTGLQNCLALAGIDTTTLDNAPTFDTTMLPAHGQSAIGWDTNFSNYWANPGAGTGGTGTGTGLETSTPSTGTANATAVPTTTSSIGTGTGLETSTPASGTGIGTGSGMGTGAQQMQGVMLATDILGATVTVSPQGNDQGTGTGTGTGLETSTPASGTGSSLETSTPASGTGSGTGTGTTTGDFSTGTADDLIIQPLTGNLQYLVVDFGTQSNLIPLPIGFLRWDSTTNGFVLMVSPNALQNAPTFSPDQFPDTSMSGWDQEWSTYWQNNGGMGIGTGTGSGVSVATATP